MQGVGLNLVITSEQAFPAGKEYFNHVYVEDYTAFYHPEAIIARSSWTKGRAAKLKLFEDYHLWDVGIMSSPQYRRR